MRLAGLLAALALAAAPLRAQTESSCATNCHGLEQTAFAASVHARVLSCTDCHGGDPTALRDKERSHSAAAGFTGKIPRERVPELCGNCHADPVRMFAFALPTDQLAHYRTSAHGHALFERGDTDVATCIDCHGSHRILPAQDPLAPTNRARQPETCGRCHADAALMGRHGLSADVVAEFESSVHGQALLVEQSRGAPSCADCHGSHGAAPPGVDSIVNVCAHCHASTGDAYRKSAHFTSGAMGCTECHAEAATDGRFQASGCAACHGAHATPKPDESLLHGEQPGHCGHCHRDDAAAGVVSALADGTTRLRATMDETQQLLREAKDRGLFLDNEQVFLRESLRTLVSVQPLSHSLDAGAIRAHLEDGIKRQDRTREMIDRKDRQLRDRRLLLGGASVVLLILAGLMAVKLDALRKLS